MSGEPSRETIRWCASLSFASVFACTSAPTVVASPTPSAETPDPVDVTPVALAEYRGGSSCNLILSDGALYWALQGSKPSTPPTTVPALSMATGAVLDCSKTRGTIMSVATSGDAPARVVAETEGWPWSLREDETHLYWVGYCDSQLWTVTKTGGRPTMLATPDISVIDHLALPSHVLIADRFGMQRGIYSLDLGAREQPRAELVAARALAPWLIGVIGPRVYWGEGEGEGETWVASSSEIGDLAGERELGPFRGMPTDTVATAAELFVLTTRALVRVSAGEPPTEIAAVAEYGDRGNLALDETHAYFANGKSGTISSVSRRDHARREAHVGGEPCGVAIDERHLYWLDRGRERVMRAPLSIFDAAPPPAEASEAVSPPEPPELTGPPPGLELDLRASPVRVDGGWGLDLRLEVTVSGEPGFDLAGVPAPHLYGETQHRDGQTSGFGDGCSTGFDDDSVLRRGHSRVFERRHGQDELDVTEPGETLTLDVGLCQVGLPDGRWERVPGAEVVLEVTDADEARVTITERGAATP